MVHALKVKPITFSLANLQTFDVFFSKSLVTLNDTDDTTEH
jgi:hypothetical protein